MAPSWRRKESEVAPQKQLPTPTTPMTALLANTPNQAETLLHSLERAASGIGLHVNAHSGCIDTTIWMQYLDAN